MPIFWPLRRCLRPWRARTLSAALAIGLLAGLLPAGLSRADQPGDPCAGLLPRLQALLDRYTEAGAKAIANGEVPAEALEAARARAIKGDAQATVTMVGVALLIHGRRDMFPVSLVRQVCTLAARNGVALHIATCAYFTALNPLGDKDDRRRAVEAEIERFAKAQGAPKEGSAPLAEAISGHVDALKACLPRA